MGTEAQKEYAAFEEKVKRTVYLDNLSPQVTEPVIKAAFEQYGNVISTHFIPNYTDCYHWMPRPVVARAAEPGMFDERPANPDRKIQLYWLDPKDPDFEVAQNLKNLTKKHFAERAYLLERQHVEEEKLSKKQVEALKIHHQKYDMMDSVLSDSGSKHLAREYGLNLTDDVMQLPEATGYEAKCNANANLLDDAGSFQRSVSNLPSCHFVPSSCKFSQIALHQLVLYFYCSM